MFFHRLVTTTTRIKPLTAQQEERRVEMLFIPLRVTASTAGYTIGLNVDV
jgi:hypothetical protein